MFLRPAGLLLVLFVQIGFCYPAQASVQIGDETVEKIDALVSSKIPWSGYTPGVYYLQRRPTGYPGSRVPAVSEGSDEQNSRAPSA